jgi:hypothetical protein
VPTGACHFALQIPSERELIDKKELGGRSSARRPSERHTKAGVQDGVNSGLADPGRSGLADRGMTRAPATGRGAIGCNRAYRPPLFGLTGS